MSEAHDTPAPPSAQEQIERMDALLAQGKEAMAKMDQLYREHDIVPGSGEKVLLGDSVPERHRVIFARLLGRMSTIEEHIEDFDPASSRPASVAVGARAAGSRYRI